MTGSGKTGFVTVVIEEALSSGIPTIITDADLGRVVQRLAPGWFIVKNAHAANIGPVLLKPRSTMSLMRGPITRNEILQARQWRAALEGIDYATTSRSVLKLVSQHVGKLHVTSMVFREVTQIRSKDAKKLGPTIVEPTLELMAQAAIAKGRLSSEDRLAVAISKELGFTCVSNDNQLRLGCGRQGVSVMWGLELLVHLIEADGISAAKAGLLGIRICGANKWLGPNVFARFLARIALRP